MHRIYLNGNNLLILFFIFLISCASMSPLSVASYEGKLDVVKELIQKGEDINKYDAWGWTPLMWSCHFHNYDVALYLLEKGANPNIKSIDKYSMMPLGSTALMVAAKQANP
jgi:ankyrin repeat protein